MNSCNPISSAANKLAMIRRVRNRKNISSSNKIHAVSSVVHQTNSNLLPTASQTSLEVPRYMNTYRLESKNPFNCTLVRSVLEEVVHKQCFGLKYDPVKCAIVVQMIAGEILRRVKTFEFDRYRLVVFAQMGANENQELETAVKFLWDSSKDKFVTYSVKSGSMFTSVTCFGVYLD